MCKNVLEVLYHHAKFGEARISPAAGAAKNVEFFVCLSVCSPRFWTSEIVHQISPWRRWSTETILIPLDRGRFVLVHPCSTFSDCCHLVLSPIAIGDNTKCRSPKNGKNWGFSPTEGDRINQSRRNLASINLYDKHLFLGYRGRRCLHLSSQCDVMWWSRP